MGFIELEFEIKLLSTAVRDDWVVFLVFPVVFGDHIGRVDEPGAGIEPDRVSEAQPVVGGWSFLVDHHFFLGGVEDFLFLSLDL